MSRIAFVVDEDFEDSELIKPYAALRQAGYEVEIVGVEAGKHVRGKKGHDETIERAARDSDVASYAALVIPGGFSPDHLRTNTDVVSFVRAMTKQGRVVAAVCHVRRCCSRPASQTLTSRSRPISSTRARRGSTRRSSSPAT